MDNPFSDFFHVPNSQELLDIAFKKAMKSSAQVSKNTGEAREVKKDQGTKTSTRRTHKPS
ncbi:MAG: hypothetical protein P8Y23_13815 [Candidatus Lokiarchaeota archaeon]